MRSSLRIILAFVLALATNPSVGATVFAQVMEKRIEGATGFK